MPGGDELLVRTLSAAVLVAVALGAAWLGGTVAAAIVAMLAFMVFREWSDLTGQVGGAVLPLGGLIVLSVMVSGFGLPEFALAIALVAAAGAAIIARDAWLPAGVLYASLFGVALMALRNTPEYGFAALVFLFAVVAATDSAAYFSGRLLGGPKLWPRVSPKKTWAGAAGGLVGAIVAGWSIAWGLGLAPGPHIVAVSIVLCIACQLGDLVESAVKRHFGAKDSGHLIPGHGGVMDRVDGLVFAALAAVAIGALNAGPGATGRGLLLW